MVKGPPNERKLCRQFSLWWSEGLNISPPRDDIFYRTASSGARATSRAKQGKKTYGAYGDMQANDPIGDPLIQACTFEFKKGYNNLSLMAVLDSKQKDPLIKQFLRQVSSDSEIAETYPILIVHRDYKKPVMFMPRLLFGILTEYFGDLNSDMIIYCSAKKDEWVIFSLEVFFEYVHPDYFCELSKNE